MDEEVNKLKELIETSERILITSHIGPDGDSVSSSLLLYKLIKLNYPNKKVSVSMEEQPVGLDFLLSDNVIEFQPLQTALSSQPADLLIVLDANALHRISRHPDVVQEFLNNSSIKIAVIDHHEGLDILGADLHINDLSPAVTLDIYDIFIERLKLKKPEGYAQITLTGIYTDTGGFVYRNLNFKRVFEVVPKLLADGGDLEELVNNLNVISEKGLSILGELMTNTRFEKEYIYSFISDETAILENHEPLVQAEDIFKSQFLRSVEGRVWGFIVYKDVMTANIYTVSFRAQSGKKDVSTMAAKLGGGGHKPAAGAKFEATDVQAAVNKVLEAIEQSRAS